MTKKPTPPPEPEFDPYPWPETKKKYTLLVVFEIEIEADNPDQATEIFWAKPPVLSEQAEFPLEILEITGADGFHSRAGASTFEGWFGDI